jgi:cobalt-zinc-cadmium efflux system protein
MQESIAALDCHVVVTETNWEQIEIIKEDIKEQLKARLNIAHSSLEFEHIDHAHQDANMYGHE